MRKVLHMLLSPYRVLDLANERGMLGGQVFADLGADVIAVEPPGGSSARNLGPFEGDHRDPERSFWWWSYARGKRSVVIDLETGDGRDQLRRLAAGADFLIESAAPGYMASLGLGYEDLQKLNPSLVYVSVSPFGQDGPKAGYAATDLITLAAGGPLAVTGDADRAPLRVSVPQGYLMAGGDAAGGALVAHFERLQTGRGQHVDISAQVSTAQATMSYVLAPAIGETDARRMGGGLKVGPLNIRLLWPAKDGHVSISFLFGSAVGPFTRRFMEWVYEEGFCDEATRDKDWMNYTMLLLGGKEPISEYERIKLVIEEFTKSKTKAELVDVAMKRRLLIAPASDVRDVVESEQLASRDYWQTLAHPRTGAAIKAPGAWAKFGVTPLQLGRRAPRLGEHSAEVLSEPPRTPAVALAPGATTGDPRPLEGLKIVDLMWVVAGPIVTRAFVDFGATVVRIESTTRIDTGRTIQPFHNGTPGPENSALYQNMNAGKLGMTLDLGKPEGRDVFLDLVRWADIVCESFTPKAMRAWGLHYEALREVNPGIIMFSSCLMGQTGPISSFAGYGNLAAAYAGFFDVTGWPDRAPAGPFSAYTDFVSPRFALPSLLAALDHRRRTGQGQHIDFAQAEASEHFLAPAILDYSVNGRVFRGIGNDDLDMAPHGVYPAAGEDRWVAIAVSTGDQWRALCATMGRDDLAADASLASAEGRLASRRELDDAISAWTSARDMADCEQLLQSRGVPAHAVQNGAECYADPQLHHRGHYIPLSHPVHGSTMVEGPRFRLSRSPARVTRAGPTFGADNETVLREILGYDDERIALLAGAGALE